MINISEALKFQREIKGLSQSKLAKETGLPQQTISWSESNKGYPKIDFLIELADFYGISLDELVGRDFIPNKKVSAKNYIGSINNSGKIDFH